MSYVLIEALGKHVGETVTLRGWLYNRRSSGKLHFLEVRDGSGIVQCVMSAKEVAPEVFAAADHVTQESTVEVTGVVREHPKQKGVYELGATGYRLLSATTQEYPIGPKD